MRRAIALALVLVAPVSAQTRKPPARKPAAPPAAALKKVAPEMTCPMPLVYRREDDCRIMRGDGRS